MVLLVSIETILVVNRVNNNWSYNMDKSEDGTLTLQEYLPYKLSTLANRLSQSLADKYSKQFGISVAEWRVIAVLGENQRATAKEITLTIAMDKVKVSRTVKKLIIKQLVKTNTVTNDNRSQTIQLTPEGSSLYSSLVPIALNHQQLALQNFTDKDIVKLNKLLAKLDQNITNL